MLKKDKVIVIEEWLSCCCFKAGLDTVSLVLIAERVRRGEELLQGGTQVKVCLSKPCWSATAVSKF